jgi:anti-anti-sigma regulatory factor
MDPRTAAERPGDSWSDQVGRREPQSPLVASFTRPPARLRLAGVIDESTYPVLRRALAKATLAGDDAIRVDMAGVEFCDLAGLRMIVSVATPSGQNRAAAGQVVIADLPVPLTDLMHILGWDAAPGVVLLDACR